MHVARLELIACSAHKSGRLRRMKGLALILYHFLYLAYSDMYIYTCMYMYEHQRIYTGQSLFCSISCTTAVVPRIWEPKKAAWVPALQCVFASQLALLAPLALRHFEFENAVTLVYLHVPRSTWATLFYFYFHFVFASAYFLTLKQCARLEKGSDTMTNDPSVQMSDCCKSQRRFYEHVLIHIHICAHIICRDVYEYIKFRIHIETTYV